MTGNKRPHSLYCSPEERDAIGARAAAGMTVSSFVLERGLAGGRAGGAAAGLTAAERAELHAGVRRLIRLAGLVRNAAADDGANEGTAAGEEGACGRGAAAPPRRQLSPGTVRHERTGGPGSVRNAGRDVLSHPGGPAPSPCPRGRRVHRDNLSVVPRHENLARAGGAAAPGIHDRKRHRYASAPVGAHGVDDETGCAAAVRAGPDRRTGIPMPAACGSRSHGHRPLAPARDKQAIFGGDALERLPLPLRPAPGAPGGEPPHRGRGLPVGATRPLAGMAGASMCTGVPGRAFTRMRTSFEKGARRAPRSWARAASPVSNACRKGRAVPPSPAEGAPDRHAVLGPGACPGPRSRVGRLAAGSR